MKHIRTIIDKEWSEVFKNKMVIIPTLLVPMLFTILPLVMLRLTSTSFPADLPLESAGIPGNFIVNCQVSSMNATDCLQAYMLNQFLLMFMIMPIMIPITIAAYSIVGEKTTRSLEPLLATPITTLELLVGKCLSAVIPAIVATFLSFGVFVLGMLILGVSPGVIRYATSGPWLLGILVLGSIVSVIAVNFALYISSRVSDPRVAEQISAVLIVPLLLVLFAQLAGLLVINLAFMVVAVLVGALLAVGMMYLGTLIFDRETILTRWR